MSYVLTLTDGDVEALMGAIKRDDPLKQNRKLETVRQKLHDARATGRVPPPKFRGGRYRLHRLLEGESPLAITPAPGHTLHNAQRRVLAWATWHKAKVATRQIDGAVHVWLVRGPSGG